MRRRLLGWTVPAIVLLLVPGLLGSAGCSTNSSSHAVLSNSRSRAAPAHASPRDSNSIYASRWAHVYRGTETFCLRPPLSGTAKYSVHAGTPSITLAFHGFRPNTDIGLEWINNPVRGYTVGAFTTDASGSDTDATRMFRFGEVRAIAIKSSETRR